MSSYVALDDFAEYAVGTAATVVFGNIQGGTVRADEGGYAHQEGAAGQDDIVWDMVKPTARVETIYKGESLPQYAARSTWNALPTPVKFRGGVISTSTMAVYIATAYVNALEVACGGIGEAVKVNYDLIGLAAQDVVATAGSVTAPTPTAPYVWHAGAVTIGGVACRCQSFTAKIENGLTHDSSLDAKAKGAQRLPEAIDVGTEKVSASFEVRVPPYLDFTRDTPTLPIEAQVVLSNGYTTKTLTLRDLYLKPFGTELIRGEDKHSWTIECESRFNALRSAATAAWSWS